ncbi:hypothetical protein BDV96DRAFT_602611 [Lophiotrema nucula]|uniref:Transcription-silencing protein Clr2-domain-containing protein n=1 Tax=Lophiotrema nucula TaxID=690887 RepID=A0A6A5YZC2_9PLEO|nr:hypothetical protein BDV96DRAFT_602611 [Lophiotrema nucula]
MAAGTVVVPLRPGSDGDASHSPPNPNFSQINPPTLYLDKIGTMWMQRRGEARPGVAYTLEALPAGYTLWERLRKKDRSDKYLYGHPNHKKFDSPNRFYPHFEHMMDNGGSTFGCPCTVCNAQGSIIPSMGVKKSRHFTTSNTNSGCNTLQTMPKKKAGPNLTGVGANTRRVDADGNPDIYRNLIDKLRKHETVDEEINEPLSLDWRAEQDHLPKRLEDLKKPQWLAREGDIVLYVRDLPGHLVMYYTESKKFLLFDPKTKTFHGSPIWEAGHVTQPPVESTDIADLVLEEGKEMSVSYSGVRIEPLPNPNSSDKSLSKRHVYLPLHHTRPFVFFKDFLHQVREAERHPTIENALTVMSTVSLWGKYRFRGSWPDAWIYCHGIFIGSEMIGVGDVVRLLPKGDSGSSDEVTDVLVIKTIRLKLTNLDKASDNDYDEGRPYNSHIFLFGSAYTKDESRSDPDWSSESQNEDIPTIMKKWDTWYPLHPPNKEMQCSFTRVLGRLHEAEAMMLWFPRFYPGTKDIRPPNLTQGHEGLKDAREYASKHDQRIVNAFGSTWYWAESRSEALDVQTMNGLEVAKYNHERDPQIWRKEIKGMDDTSIISFGRTNAGPSTAGIGKLRGFMAPQALPVRASPTASGNGPTRSSSGSLTGTGSLSSSRKRAKTVDLSSEEEEEIRASTKIVEDEGDVRRKKSRIEVLID